jgi:uncharacterized protein YukE
MTDTIAASPSQLNGAVPTFHGQANSIADLITGLNTTTGGLISALSIQPLSSFGTDLETLYGRIGTSMNCFTTALQNFGKSLQATAQGFATTDAQLANVFNALDQSLHPYLGYDAPAMAPTMPTVTTAPAHPAAPPPAHHWWDTVGSWFSSAGSWISNHAGQIALVGGIVVVGGATIILTGGTDSPLVFAAAAAAAA